MPAPLRPIIPGDWAGLEQTIKDLWAILNEDTTLSDMVSDITVGSSDLVIVSDALVGAESDLVLVSDALVGVESDLVWMQSDLLSVAMTYKYIKATGQEEGDLHLSDGTNWNVSKALIGVIKVVTSSTDWDLYILQNDNGFAADDANIPKIQVAEEVSGNANLFVNLPYEDEDDSKEVHLYYLDNSGANTANIYILGTEMS